MYEKIRTARHHHTHTHVSSACFFSKAIHKPHKKIVINKLKFSPQLYGESEPKAKGRTPHRRKSSMTQLTCYAQRPSNEECMSASDPTGSRAKWNVKPSPESNKMTVEGDNGVERSRATSRVQGSNQILRLSHLSVISHGAAQSAKMC